MYVLVIREDLFGVVEDGDLIKVYTLKGFRSPFSKR